MNKIFFLLSAILITLTACSSHEAEVAKIAGQEKDLPVETGTNVTINYTDSGLLKAKVFAPVLERYNTENRMETEMREGITAYFYNHGQVSSYIKSKYAIRSERDLTMTARKEVQVVNNKGDTLRTEELIWEERSNRIYSKQQVRITTPDKIIMGTGLESNTEFTNFKVLNISGIIGISK